MACTASRKGKSARTAQVVATAATAVLLAGCAAGPGSGSGSGSTDSADEAPRAAMITTGAVTTGDWDPASYKAFTAMAEKYGFQASNEDSVGYDEAESILARLAQSNDLVIATSAGYGAAVMSVAPQYPDTMFVVWALLEDNGGLENVAGFSSDFNELGYVAGAAACLAAEGGKIGHVNSEPIPAFTHFSGGIEQAAEEYCPNGKSDSLETYINSFTDVSKAKLAAEDLIGNGATVLIPTIDAAATGVLEAAEASGAKLIMPYVDQLALAPDLVVTSWLLGFDPQYDEIGRLFTEGELKGEIYPETFENGGIDLVLPLANVSDEVNAQVEEIVAGLKDGSIQVDDRVVTP